VSLTARSGPDSGKTDAEIRACAIANGRARKRANALAAVLAGGVPATILGWPHPSSLATCILGFTARLLWANGFEYAYHRCLLHRPRGRLAAGHLEHHASVGTSNEAEHLALGQAPSWIVALFAVNSLPVMALDFLSGVGIAAPMLAAFTVYEITVEEVHWRIHRGEWLPRCFHPAREHHLQHHDRPSERFNIFLPLFDKVLGRPECARD
jgi:hypothetical protein